MVEQLSPETFVEEAECDRRALVVCTAGSVDDGKSTLIGRLLVDCRALAHDQLEQVERASRRRGHARVDLSLVTDGLRAEREQGITIDVAWRYFSTPRRRFILADTPGHVQYTRNMVTGCSASDVAVVLVDARHGCRDQSRRHLGVAALLGVSAIIVCVNKMDLVGWDAERFEQIRSDVERCVRPMTSAPISAIPVSAIAGDNVVTRSQRSPFYGGPTLCELLESFDPAEGDPNAPLRFPVQWVVRSPSPASDDARGYSGRLESGRIAVGDRIVVHPSRQQALVGRVEVGGIQVPWADSRRSVVVHLDRDIDVSRGDVIAHAGPDGPWTGRELTADLLWLSERAVAPGASFRLKLGTKVVRASLTEIRHVLDPATLQRSAAASLAENDLAGVVLRTGADLSFDTYDRVRGTGSFILVDDATGDTVGAGMVRAAGHTTN